jgi:hypothetical protein
MKGMNTECKERFKRVNQLQRTRQAYPISHRPPLSFYLYNPFIYIARQPTGSEAQPLSTSTISYNGRSRRRAYPLRPDSPPTATSTTSAGSSSSWPSTLGSPIDIMPKASSSARYSRLSPNHADYRHTVYGDVEAHTSPSSPRRFGRRFGMTKRSQWILGFTIAATTIILFTYHKQESMEWMGGLKEKIGGSGKSAGGSRPEGMDDIWHSPQDGGHDNDGDRWGDTARPTTSKPDADGVPWKTNVHGDKFRRQPLPPAHPDISTLPPPSSLFPEVDDINSFLRPPEYKPFSESRIREVISEPPPVTPVDTSGYASLPDDAYSKTWQRPEFWEGHRGDMRKLQWEGFSSGRRDTWETKEEGNIRMERRDAVKRGFVYAWQKYKDYAWGESQLHRLMMSIIPALTTRS